MYSVQPYFVESVSHRARCFQADVVRLADRYSLRLEGGYPALELQAQPHFQALLEYTLWGENGLVTLKAKLPYLRDRGEEPEPFQVTMRFSHSHDPGMDVESKKLRIEEYFHNEAELFWNIPPVGHEGHLELTLHFMYDINTSRLSEYTGCVLGIITGKHIAA